MVKPPAVTNISGFKNHPFPTNYLVPLLRNACMEAEKQTQAPAALIGSAALAALSVACQLHVRVALPNGKVVPVSLFFLTFATSGERKTTVDTIFFKSIRSFVKLFDDQHEEKQASFNTETEIWQEKRKALVSKLKHAMKKDLPTDAHDAALASHLKVRPVLPKTPKIIFTDATPEAIAMSLHEQWPSAALISDEASLVLGGQAARNLAMFNKLWDGDDYIVDRKSTASFKLSAVSFGISLMIQPKVFDQFSEHQGKDARKLGFFGRCLVTWPESTQGYRLIDSFPDATGREMTAFHEVITANLHEGGVNTAASKVTLELSSAAKEEWRQIYNCIESQLREGQCWSDVQDAASKSPEMIVRMAALFHHVEGRTGQIQPDSIQQAYAICIWYLWEFKRIFGEKAVPPPEQVYAQTLEDWLREHYLKTLSYAPIPKNYLRKYGPNSLRNKDKLNSACYELVKMGKISPHLIKNVEVFILNDYFFNTGVNLNPGIFKFGPPMPM